jgi:hypothetical protein
MMMTGRKHREEDEANARKIDFHSMWVGIRKKEDSFFYHHLPSENKIKGDGDDRRLRKKRCRNI